MDCGANPESSNQSRAGAIRRSADRRSFVTRVLRSNKVRDILLILNLVLQSVARWGRHFNQSGGALSSSNPHGQIEDGSGAVGLLQTLHDTKTGVEIQEPMVRWVSHSARHRIHRNEVFIHLMA